MFKLCGRRGKYDEVFYYIKYILKFLIFYCFFLDFKKQNIFDSVILFIVLFINIVWFVFDNLDL